jgi:hypothetical protein
LNKPEEQKNEKVFLRMKKTSFYGAPGRKLAGIISLFCPEMPQAT